MPQPIAVSAAAAMTGPSSPVFQQGIAMVNGVAANCEAEDNPLSSTSELVSSPEGRRLRATGVTPLGQDALPAAAPVAAFGVRDTASSAWGCGHLSTPTNRQRPDLHTSVQLMTATFHGSAPSAAAVPSYAGSWLQGGASGSSQARRPPSRAGAEFGMDFQAVAAPMLALSLSGSSSGPRPQTAPVPASYALSPSSPIAATYQYPYAGVTTPVGTFSRGGYPTVTPLEAVSTSSSEYGGVGPTLPTPTNSMRCSQARVMMPRSSRSIRHFVQSCRTTDQPAQVVASGNESVTLSQAVERSPVSQNGSVMLVHAPSTEVIPSTPSQALKRPGTPSQLLNTEVVTAGAPATWEALATPKNSDRRDMDFSLRLGAPAFKGSIAEPGRPAPAATAQPRVLQTPAGWKPPTPAGVANTGLCFHRA